MTPPLSAQGAAMRRLRLVPLPDGDDADRSWLYRIELRSRERVVEFLERTEFPRRPGLIAALFLDKRCGMIAREFVALHAFASVEEPIREILHLASFHHAHGIILASNDSSESLSEARRRQELTRRLLRKGDAMEVFVLDHVVRTATGWKSQFPRFAAGAGTCS